MLKPDGPCGRQIFEIREKTMHHTCEISGRSLASREYLRAWCWILLILGAVIAAPMAAEKGKPLSVRDVSELLKGSVPSSEIARLVERTVSLSACSTNWRTNFASPAPPTN